MASSLSEALRSMQRWSSHRRGRHPISRRRSPAVEGAAGAWPRWPVAGYVIALIPTVSGPTIPDTTNAFLVF